MWWMTHARPPVDGKDVPPTLCRHAKASTSVSCMKVVRRGTSFPSMLERICRQGLDESMARNNSSSGAIKSSVQANHALYKELQVRYRNLTSHR